MNSIALRLLLCKRKENLNVKAIRRQLRDNLSDSLFRQYYRLNKPVFIYLLDIFTNFLAPLKQKFGIPHIIKLSACLRSFAEGGHQKGVGKDHEVGLSQSSFSEVHSEGLNILEPLLCTQWITWPTLEEQRQIAHDFYTSLEPWLLTSYRTPKSGSLQAKLNEVHTRCRNIIEEQMVFLKTWRCLLRARELYYAKAIKIINVCSALHNICIHYKSEANVYNPYDNEDFNNISTEENQQIREINNNYLVSAQHIRTEITNTL